MSKILASTALVGLLALTSNANAFDRHGNLKQIVTKTAYRHGVSPSIAWAVVKVESSGNCNAVSHAGAVGVMQVKPATAREMGVRGNLKSCENSIEAGMRYLKKAMVKYRSLCSALSAYNIGLYGGGRCTGYGKKVMRVAAVRIAYGE
jgi:soluble lytic murein transglycosylase-like protein